MLGISVSLAVACVTEKIGLFAALDISARNPGFLGGFLIKSDVVQDETSSGTRPE